MSHQAVAPVATESLKVRRVALLGGLRPDGSLWCVRCASTAPNVLALLAKLAEGRGPEVER